MEVWMVGEGLTPGVEHCDESDLGTEMTRVGRDLLEGLGSTLKQQGVELTLVLQCERGQLGEEREDHVEVGNGK
jgi:hypothetical protein